MRVILSVDPIRFPLTGIGRYTYELAKHLPYALPELELDLMMNGRFVDRLPVESTATDPQRSSTVAERLRRWLQNNSIVAVAAYRTWQSHRETRSLKGCEHAIFHGPSFHLPPYSGPSVVTIHDLSVFSWPHCHPPGRVRTMRREIIKSVAQASVIVTDSEFTRREVAAFFSLPLGKVHAVPLASASCFRPRTNRELLNVLPRLGLEVGGYCLYSGTIEPRKNLGLLLDAYSMLPERLRRNWPLVLCGYQGWRSADLHERISKAENQGWVRYLGYINGADLPYVYAGARLFVFPSLYEGFGLPVLEAMASGVPVICSNSSSLPEVAGEAALMCEPDDVNGLSSLLQRGLQDEGWRHHAQARGLEQSARFKWLQCAEKTGEAYKSALYV